MFHTQFSDLDPNTKIFRHKAIPFLIIIYLLISLGINLFKFNQFRRSANDPLDLRQIYIGAILLKGGSNPYDDNSLKEEWKKLLTSSNTESKEIKLPGGPENYLVYPPHTLFLSQPIANKTWHRAGTIQWLISGVCILLSALVLVREEKLGIKILGFIMLLGFKGTYTAAVLAQPLLLCIPFILLSLRIGSTKNWFWAGLIFSISYIKPSIALPFFLYFIGEKQFKLLASSLIPMVIIYSFILFQIGDALFIESIQGWLLNMHLQTNTSLTEGHDFLRSNLTSITSAFYSIGKININPAAIIFSILSFGSVLILRMKSHISNTKSLLLLLLTSFLFSYHLYYDLLLLICVYFLYFKTKCNFLKMALVFSIFLPFGFIIGDIFNMHTLILITLFILESYEAYIEIQLKPKNQNCKFTNSEITKE